MPSTIHKNRKELGKLIIFIIHQMFSLPQLFFWVCHIEFHIKQDKNAAYFFANICISSRDSQLKNFVKYANDMNDDVIHSTQYYIKSTSFPGSLCFPCH